MQKSVSILGIIIFLSLLACSSQTTPNQETEKKQPNILFAISDDQSFPYTSIYGDKTTITPNFDAIAKRGVLFNNAFVAAPQCSPSRAAILTGRNIWQLEEAGTHGSYFPKKHPVFTDVLEANGYALGYTGKPWGPGNYKDAGWKRNPVGPEYNAIKLESVPYTGIRNTNYSANFKAFLDKKAASQPFFFWYGASEPHRVFEKGSGLKEGKKLADVNVPDFLPDDAEVRGDILDYSVEIEWFDKHLGEILAHIEAAGELDNTIVVITADNGMAFPYAKANLQEYGTHVPLAIAGPTVKGGRVVNDLVATIDLAPTFLELSNTPTYQGITGRSLVNILQSEKQNLVDESRQMVLTGRERHTHARPNNFGYPARAIRTQDFLFIKNLKPDRWPAGDPAIEFPTNHQLPKGFKAMNQGYHDIDACPSKTHLLEQAELADYLELAVGKRPAEQLFDIKNDPGCTKNLANDPSFAATLKKLDVQLVSALTEQGDPRMLGTGDVFESYPRFGGMREFAGFKERGAYNPVFQAKIKD